MPASRGALADAAGQCREVKSNLTLFVVAPERLTMELIEEIGDHLQNCPSCRDELYETGRKQGLVK